MGSLQEMMRDFIALSAEIEDAEDRLATLKASKLEAQRALWDRMLDEGVQHVKLEDKTIYRHTSVRGSILAAHRAEAYEALKELNLGDLIKTEATVHSSTMAAKIREWIETDGKVPDIIEPFLSVHEEHSVRVLKS